jgi:hypothetical protein
MTQTFYERMFLAEGKPITYIKFYVDGRPEAGNGTQE